MKRGRAGAVTHDYKRHATTTLFAALSTLDGSVLSMCQPRHRHGDKRIRRDSFTSVAELELAIDLYVDQHNIDPKPSSALPAVPVAQGFDEVFYPDEIGARG